MSAIFNPLSQIPEPKNESTSSLINDVMGTCPKCKQPFGSGLIDTDTVYYCATCRVSQPAPT